MEVSMFVEYIIPNPTTLNSSKANNAISIATPRSSRFDFIFIASLSSLAAGLETDCCLRTIVEPDGGDETGNRPLSRLRINCRALQSQRRLYRVNGSNGGARGNCSGHGQTDRRSVVIRRKDIRVHNALHFDLVYLSQL